MHGVLGYLLLASYASAYCPLYGPLFPRPTNLLQDSAVQAVAAALDDAFVKSIDNDTSVGSAYFSYAVEVFAASEDKPLWSHYWTAPVLKYLNSTGVSTVDANTVFRIGSVTKIFTILTFLATVGDGIWNDPVTWHLPDIQNLARKASGGPIFTPDWDSITIGSLASQTSGLIRDYSLLGELSYEIDLNSLYDIGFPPLPLTDYPPCGTWPPCNRTQLLAGLAKLPPSFPPFHTPAYSDVAFVLLSYVAERITGKDFKTLLTDTVLKPLNLTHTYIDLPNDSVGIIPGTSQQTTWGAQMGDEWPTGNMYSSAADLSTLGRAILRSTILKPAKTRRWLKPTIFSSDPRATVGMPWGIRRIELGTNETYQFVHTFDKLGSLGSYSALLAIIPELDIGFSVLTAGDAPAGLATGIAEALADTYIPAHSFIARAQANTTFAGTYRHASLLVNTTTTTTPSNGTTSTPPYSNTTRTTTAPYSNSTVTPSSAPQILNSSLTITVDPTSPGLNITSWISNGTDMARMAVALNANVSSSYLSQLQPSVRLYPTGLEQPLDSNSSDGGSSSSSGGRQVAFKAVFEDLSVPPASPGSFVTDCATWVGLTGVVYASQPLDLFVFEIGADGAVKAVVNEALRVRLEKVD